MSNFLSTKELEKHIKDTYTRVESYAREDNVYKPLDVYFDIGTPHGEPGDSCYSDDEGYHIGGIEIRGDLTTTVTDSLFEATYQVLRDNIFWMSAQYELKNRVKGQDSRRIMFDRRLQYWNAIGEEFAEREEARINEVLERNPFVD